MKLQAFDSKRRITNICCTVVGLGLIKLVFGAYIMSGGTLFDFNREEKIIDPKAQALANAREKQLLAIKKANNQILVSQKSDTNKITANQTASTSKNEAKNTVKNVTKISPKDAQSTNYLANNVIKNNNSRQDNNLHVEADLLAQASAATISSMQTKKRHAVLESALIKNNQAISEAEKQELAQDLDIIEPQYKAENKGFSFSLVGTAHAEEAINSQNIDPHGIDAKDYVRPDQSLTSTNIPVPTIENPYDSPKVLSYKEAELNQKEEELLSLQEQMNSRMKELNQLEDKLGNMVQQANSVEDDKYTHLIATYAAMKPRKAAEALSTLDEKIAVRILNGMKSKQSGEIFSYMDPVQAARLSKAMTKLATF